MQIKTDLSVCLELMRAVGNGAHVIRNPIASKSKQEQPELTAIDNSVADIENKCRQVMQIVYNDTKQNILIKCKPLLLQIYRSAAFCLRTLETLGSLEYETLQQQELELVKKTLEGMRDTTKCADSILNDAYTSYMCSLQPDSRKCLTSQQLIQQQQEFCKKQDFSKAPPAYDVHNGSPSSLREHLSELCNRAHDIQNIACVHGIDKKSKDLSKLVVNQAGNIENIMRAVIQAIAQYQDSQLVENFKKQVNDQANALQKESNLLEGEKQQIQAAFNEKDAHAIDQHLRSINCAKDILFKIGSQEQDVLVFG